MMTIYRGYDIEPTSQGGFMWKDERGFEHWFSGTLKAPYATEELAMDDIDAYRKTLRQANTPKSYT